VFASRRRLGAALIGVVALAAAPVPAAAAPWTPPTCAQEPRCVEMVAPLGATGFNSHEYAFVKAADGHAWVQEYSAEARIDEWADLGAPPGGTIDAAVGAVVVGAMPELFVRSAGGVLWQATNDGSGWRWTNHRRPAGVWLTKGYGTIVAGGTQYALVLGTDGNLWARSRTAGVWTWVNAGRPATTTVDGLVGTTVAGQRPHVFVKGADGDLWLLTRTGGAWTWTRHGRPGTGAVGAGFGALTVIPEAGAERPSAVVTGGDGNLWSRSATGSGWAWTNLGRPTGTGIHSGAGAHHGGGDDPQVFVRGVDGQLWRRTMAGDAPGWASFGRPPGTGIDVAYGAFSEAGAGHAGWTVFVKGGDGRLWYRSGVGTFLLDWYDRGHPYRSLD
jgi:hypothetical protein